MTEDEQAALDAKWEQAISDGIAAKKAVLNLIDATKVKWSVHTIPNWKGLHGRLPRSQRWNNMCAALIVTELSATNADIDTPIGPKPTMPNGWD